MTAILSNVTSTILNVVQSAYEYLTHGEVELSERYSVLRHTRPIILYRSTKTTVPISVFGTKSLPKKRRVFLQKRGFRTGLFGWTIGSLMGGSKLPGLEVTPASAQSYSSIPSNLLRSYEKDIERVWKPYNLANQTLLETMQVHIPVASGDGYFRLRITPHDKPKETVGVTGVHGKPLLKLSQLAVSPVFRIGSITWASASPQGATLAGIVPELVVRSAFVTANVAMWAGFYAMFPIFKIAHYTPGPVKTFVAKNVYQYVGGPDPKTIDGQYKVTERMKRAQENFNRKIPYGAASIRTVYDLEKDEELGKQGVAYSK